MKFDLENKKALITGSSRGIGFAIAKIFAQSGAIVAVHYNTAKEKAEKVVEELDGDGHIIVQADLSDIEGPKKLMEEVINNFGGLDILVNNAGIYDFHPVLNTDYNKWLEIWQKTMNVNLIASANLSFFAAANMKEKGGGKIINITSRGAFRGEPDAPAYGASKAGMNSMSQSMAKALAPDNILVYAIAPGFVETDMATEILDGPDGDNIRNQSPLKRVAQPEEIARTAAFLASEGTGYLTGTIVDVNGASYLR